MGKEEFIKKYCDRSGLTWEWLQQYKVVLPCACGEDCCKGWAMVSNEPDMIKTHMELYAPNAVLSGAATETTTECGASPRPPRTRG